MLCVRACVCGMYERAWGRVLSDTCPMCLSARMNSLDKVLRDVFVFSISLCGLALGNT